MNGSTTTLTVLAALAGASLLIACSGSTETLTDGSGATDTPAGGTTSGGGAGGTASATGGTGGTANAAGGTGGTRPGTGGSGGAMSGAAGSAGNAAALFTPVGTLIQMTCATAACHGGRQRPSLSDTNPTTLYNTLKSTAVRQCGSDRLATPNDPANSALLELVQQQCGTFVMPAGCNTNPCISASDIATITAWIQAGAPAP